MALPKIVVKTTPIEQPVSKKVLQVKPMTVAQQISMMEAHESNNTAKQVTVLKDILNGCVVEDSKFKIGKMLYVEAEYLLMKVRAISGSDPTESVKLPNDSTIYTVNLMTDVSVVGESVPGFIDIPSDTPMKIKMILPTLEMVEREASLNGNLGRAEQAYGLILDCIESIASEETVTICGKDITSKELRTFIGEFSANMFEPITKFFSHIPQVVLNVAEVNKKLVGLTDIFAAINDAKKQ